MATTLNMLREQYHQSKEHMLQDFFTFLQFASISSEKEYEAGVTACANWLKGYIEKIGLATEMWETAGYPVIFASYLEAGPDKPTVLIYNHYDVQPVDPLELWLSPPFEPTIREGEIYARGAQDNKGQCFYVLQALKILLNTEGTLPVNIKLCIEGEEESGSTGLAGIIQKKKRELQANYLAVVDAGIPRHDSPAINLGARGMTMLDVEVQGSRVDLHSGEHGGIVFNPIHALVDVLSKVRDSSGKITIPGFYDAIQPLTEEEMARIDFDFDAKEYMHSFGAKPAGGESSLPPLERAWIRPTLEINGISGGYTGQGFKTVIPSTAHAKISCRLVPNQNPHHISELVASYLRKHCPEGVEIKVTVLKGEGEAVRTPPTTKIAHAFSQAYEEVFQTPCRYILQGGSVPIINKLQDASDSSAVFVGLGLPEDHIHAPNEHFGIDRLEKGSIATARALQHLSRS